MVFDSLADAERGYAKLQAEIDVMHAMLTGVTVILSSLMAKQPDYDQFQLHLTSLVELAENGSLGNPLSPRQKEVARAYVESLQQISESRAAIRPLG